MKKYIWMFVLISLVAVMLLACGGSAAPTSATTPKPAAPASTTAPQPTTTTAAKPPAIPADHGKPVDAARQQCLVCHQTGVGGAPAVPASHAGRGNDVCQTCHTPA